MANKQKIHVRAQRQVITYGEMWHTSGCLLDRGLEQEKASAHQFRASLVFTAFTLEAYLNHVGKVIFGCWADLESLAPKPKLNLLVERLATPIDYSSRPWQIMHDLFKFRNAIAHGKSESLEREEILSHVPDPAMRKAEMFMLTTWEAFCTKQNAANARADVEKIISIIHDAGARAGFDLGPVFGLGFQSRHSTVLAVSAKARKKKDKKKKKK